MKGKWMDRLKKARDKIADFHDSVSNGASKLSIPDDKLDRLINQSPFDSKPEKKPSKSGSEKLKKRVIKEEYYE